MAIDLKSINNLALLLQGLLYELLISEHTVYSDYVPF